MGITIRQVDKEDVWEIRASNKNMNVNFIQFEEEGHISVLPPLINKAIKFSFNTQSNN